MYLFALSTELHCSCKETFIALLYRYNLWGAVFENVSVVAGCLCGILLQTCICFHRTVYVVGSCTPPKYLCWSQLNCLQSASVYVAQSYILYQTKNTSARWFNKVKWELHFIIFISNRWAWACVRVCVGIAGLFHCIVISNMGFTLFLILNHTYAVCVKSHDGKIPE